LTKILRVLGFILALITFMITRMESSKKLSIDLYCQSLEELDKNNEFYLYNSEIKEGRVIS
jgi:hypothetical protein